MKNPARSPVLILIPCSLKKFAGSVFEFVTLLDARIHLRSFYLSSEKAIMVVNWDEQERVRQLLTEAITVLCKNGLKYSSKFCVEGLLGITLDDNDILLVNIKETIASGSGSSAGISVSPMQSRPPSLSSRSPMGMGQRMALTSPRRGRAKPIMVDERAWGNWLE